MSLLSQIEDKGAVLEWSPIQALPNLVALGTKVMVEKMDIPKKLQRGYTNVLYFCWLSLSHIAAFIFLALLF
jgi:hypothetical protein